jgi:hypothetical protein
MSPLDRVPLWLLALVNVLLANALGWFVVAMGWPK